MFATGITHYGVVGNITSHADRMKRYFYILELLEKCPRTDSSQ